MDYNPYEQFGKPEELIFSLENLNDDYPARNKSNLTEKEIYLEFAKHISPKEKQTIEAMIASEEDMSMMTFKQAAYLDHLLMTNYLFAIDQDRYYLSAEFLNKYNQYVLRNKFGKLTLPDDEEKDMLSSLRTLEEKRELYDNLILADYLYQFTVKDLKQICRIFHIKGFSKGTGEDIKLLIEQKFMEDPAEIFKQLTPDALALSAYFLLEGRNTIPYDEMGELDLEVFFISEDEEAEVLYMPGDVYQDLDDYFDYNDMNPLDYIRPEEREIYEDMIKMKAFHSMTDTEPDNIDEAIAAFAEVGQDPEMRQMLSEIIGFDENDPDDAVEIAISQIMDGKIKSEEDLERLFDTLESDETPEPKKKNNTNIIDFNQYRK